MQSPPNSEIIDTMIRIFTRLNLTIEMPSQVPDYEKTALHIEN